MGGGTAPRRAEEDLPQALSRSFADVQEDTFLVEVQIQRKKVNHLQEHARQP